MSTSKRSELPAWKQARKLAESLSKTETSSEAMRVYHCVRKEYHAVKDALEKSKKKEDVGWQEWETLKKAYVSMKAGLNHLLEVERADNDYLRSKCKKADDDSRRVKRVHPLAWIDMPLDQAKLLLGIRCPYDQNWTIQLFEVFARAPLGGWRSAAETRRLLELLPPPATGFVLGQLSQLGLIDSATLTIGGVWLKYGGRKLLGRLREDLEGRGMTTRPLMRDQEGSDVGS